MGENERAFLDAMQFVKVSVTEGISTYAGYLTEASCLMLLVELQRSGFVVARPIRPNSSDNRQKP